MHVPHYANATGCLFLLRLISGYLQASMRCHRVALPQQFLLRLRGQYQPVTDRRSVAALRCAVSGIAYPDNGPQACFTMRLADHTGPVAHCRCLRFVWQFQAIDFYRRMLPTVELM